MTIRSVLHKPYTLALAFTVLCMTNVVVRYPGMSNPDSILQQQQIASGSFDDWHPPAMTRLWQFLLNFGEGSAPIYLWNLVLYWLAFALTSLTLWKLGFRGAAWICVAIAALPLFWMLNVNIATDITFAAAMLFGFSLIFYNFALEKHNAWLVVIGLCFLVFGSLVRHNALLAVGPLVALTMANKIGRKPLWLLGFSVALALFLFPVNKLINQHVLGARDAHAIQSLQVFDIAGIAKESGDLSVLGPAAAVTQPMLEYCYSPVMWDTFAHWGQCPWFRRVAMGDGWTDTSSEATLLQAKWRQAILGHPLSYLTHRLKFFNSTLYFIVPEDHTREIRETPGYESADKRGFTGNVRNFLRYSVLFSPATTLFLSLGLSAILILGRKNIARLGVVALCLVFSASLYTGGYFLVGVAADQRYFFYPTLVTYIALIIAYCDGVFSFALRRQKGLLIGVGAMIAVTLAVQLVARTYLATPATIKKTDPSNGRVEID